MASVNHRTRNGRKVWLAQVNIKGFERLSKQFDDRKAAKVWAEDQERSLRRLAQAGGASPEVSTLTIAQLSERFLRDPKVKKLKYLTDLETLLQVWLDAYGQQKVRAFGAVQIVDVRDKLAVSVSPARVNRYLSAMRRCWNWGRETGLVDSTAVWPQKVMLTEPRGRTRHLSDEELASVLDAAAAHSSTMHAAIVLSIATGVRQGELLRLEWPHVNLAKSYLTVHESKNGEPRTVFLPSSAAAVLRALKRGGVVGQRYVFMQDDEPLRKSTLEARWKRIRKAAGLSDFRWHDLRHSCASYLAQSGASLLEIGSVLGHKSPSVTMRYSHLVAGKPVTGHDKLNAKLGG